MRNWQRCRTALTTSTMLMATVRSKQMWGHSLLPSWKQGEERYNPDNPHLKSSILVLKYRSSTNIWWRYILCCNKQFAAVVEILVASLWPNTFLPVSLHRQLLSWYTVSQNSNVSAADGCPALLPLWVRCDMSDPAGTTWFGAENISLRDRKAPGVKFYSVTCRGSATHLQHVSLALTPVPSSRLWTLVFNRLLSR